MPLIIRLAPSKPSRPTMLQQFCRLNIFNFTHWSSPQTRSAQSDHDQVDQASCLLPSSFSHHWTALLCPLLLSQARLLCKKLSRLAGWQQEADIDWELLVLNTMYISVTEQSSSGKIASCHAIWKKKNPTWSSRLELEANMKYICLALICGV